MKKLIYKRKEFHNTKYSLPASFKLLKIVGYYSKGKSLKHKMFNKGQVLKMCFFAETSTFSHMPNLHAYRRFLIQYKKKCSII